ncbi:Pleckstrin-like proteiny domain-containing family F member 2 [Zootermopsis nevadensis]|uniref:Pleckstrin-like proteiny domain-containing family F member 2 n=1 Tax=Zootermopsis nevadensis TaxID=136037 RepID=A0A067RH96_ZOONE|nr:Pleckstrin-like proteiny domain-containing family F member 2 [Zootermopsis nevadensis]
MVDRLVNSEANARRIAMVESCFGSSGQPLGVPGRVLVGEGVLTKMCRKKPKARQFFLFNDILVYGNIVINKKKYNKQHIIPLEEVKLESLEDDGRGKKAVEVHAAVWVPDSEAAVCMHCKKTQFTMLNRRACVSNSDEFCMHACTLSRLHATKDAFPWIFLVRSHLTNFFHFSEGAHTIKVSEKKVLGEVFVSNKAEHHCRKCGAVVCGPCSNKRFLLPSQSSKPLRVCLNCYDTLTRARVQQNNVGGNPAENSLSKEAKERSGSGDSSGEEDSDEEDEASRSQQDASAHDESKFYGMSEDHKQ